MRAFAGRSVGAPVRDEGADPEPRADLEHGTDQDAPVRLDLDGVRRSMSKWGLVPFFTKDLASGRADQCPVGKRGEIAAVQEAFAKRRCLAPAAACMSGGTILQARRPSPEGRRACRLRRYVGGMAGFDGERLRTFATMTIDATRRSLIQGGCCHHRKED
jgi:hypothetical protein